MTLQNMYLVCSLRKLRLVTTSAGYYAVGTSVWMVAIAPMYSSTYREQDPENNTYRKVMVTDLLHLDLSTRRGRLEASPKIIRLARILMSLGKVIQPNVDADMMPLKRSACLSFIVTSLMLFQRQWYNHRVLSRKNQKDIYI